MKFFGSDFLFWLIGWIVCEALLAGLLSLKNKKRLSSLTWYQAILILFGIIAGPFIIMYAIVAAMGRI